MLAGSEILNNLIVFCAKSDKLLWTNFEFQCLQVVFFFFFFSKSQIQLPFLHLLRATSIDPAWLLDNQENYWEDRKTVIIPKKGMTSLSPNSAENFEDQGGRHYVLSMYIKIFRDISTYILTRYRFYNDGFIVKPQPRANTIKREKKNYNTGGFLTSSRRLYSGKRKREFLKYVL